MTRTETAAHTTTDRASHGLPGSASGPNKASSAPSGTAALASEIGAERDARRELLAAQRSGESVSAPSQATSTNAASLGFGQLNGAEQGISTPGDEKRDQMQSTRNAEIHKPQPDLRKIAQNSAGSASHTTSGSGDPKSTGAGDVGELLDTAGRSTGTESGTGAAKVGEVEIGRDATTTNTA